MGCNMVFKKAKKNATDVLKTGVTLGVGSQVLGKVGSPQGQAAVGNLSKFLPIGSKVAGAGFAISATKMLVPKKTKKRRK